MMSNATDPIRSVDDRVNDIAGALEAIRLSVRDAMILHKAFGNPVAVWRNDRVEWIQPEDIVIDPLPTAEDRPRLPW